MTRRAGRAWFVGLVVVLAVASCSWPLDRAGGGSASEPAAARPLQPVPAVMPDGFTKPPPGAGLSRYANQPLDWRPCQRGLQCATVLVPLDYLQPDATAISLALARKPATATPRLGTLLINPGGPGGSGVDYVGFFPRAGLEGYDVVGWDPRGVARSTPVSCAGADLDRYVSLDITPNDPGEEAALVDADRELGLACLEQAGVLLRHVSTVEVARDLDLLRVLVGDSRLNFFGASYGTRIGATYAELFPAQVGRMVLDGAVNITEDTSIGQAQGFERALGSFAQWCVAKRCQLGATRAEVFATIVAFWNRSDSSPLTVGGRQLTQQLALGGVVAALYGNAAGYPDLQRALEDASFGDNGARLLRLADRLNARDDKGRYGQINYAFPAVRCLDTQDRGLEGERRRAAEASRTAPTVGQFFGADLQCALWPVAAVPKLKLVGEGANPIVVIGTTGDPATPYEHAVSMAEQLQSAVLLTFRGVGHTAFGQSSCVRQRVNAYLVTGVVPADGTVC